MAMQGYFDIFPDKVGTELRNITVQNGSADDPLPGGRYLFIEYFCTDPKCNCQRVLVKVIRVESEDARPEEVATISYSWNPKTDELWRVVNSKVANPFLDPCNRQAPYAPQLLEFWVTMIEHDQVYVARLKRHYDEIRAEVGQTQKSRRHSANLEAGRGAARPLTKRDRKVRKQLLARARTRQ